MNRPNKFELAVSASGLNKIDVSRKLGFKSYYPLADRLDDPGLFRLSELKQLIAISDETGKDLIESAMDDFFCSGN